MAALSVRPNGAEDVGYNAPDYPVRTRDGDLIRFVGYAAACHWHEDFELLLPVQGGLNYFVNGARVYVPEGCAIFVHSRRLHYGYAHAQQDCRYRVLLFHPSWPGRFAPVAAAVDHLSADGSADDLLLTPEADGAALAHIRAVCKGGGAENVLAALAHCAALTSLLCRRVADAERADGADDVEWQALRRMTGSVMAHYAGKVRLSDVAAAGAVCRSRCCRIFRDRLNQTPNAYLTAYRLDRACDRIRGGAQITEAALSSGFDSTSYFSETFRKVFGLSPSRWRDALQRK